MRVLLSDGSSKRYIFNGALMRENSHTAWILLANGDWIKRNKLRDFVDYEGDRAKEKSFEEMSYAAIRKAQAIVDSKQNPIVHRKGFIKRFFEWVTLVLKRITGVQRREKWQ